MLRQVLRRGNRVVSDDGQFTLPDGSVLPRLPGAARGYTAYSSSCVPQQPMCAPSMFGCACVEGDDGIYIVCFTGCGVG